MERKRRSWAPGPWIVGRMDTSQAVAFDGELHIRQAVVGLPQVVGVGLLIGGEFFKGTLHEGHPAPNNELRRDVMGSHDGPRGRTRPRGVLDSL
jgi:hypothetical protein